MSRLISLEVENFKRIKAVYIEPDGNLVVIGGKNAQGKTSLVDALMFLLKGKSHLSGRAIHDGEDEAFIKADLGDFTAQRTITKKGVGALIIKPKPGVVLPDLTPHAMFQKIIGPLTVDPVGFMDIDPKEQLAVIRDMIGLDTSEIDAERDGLYEARTITARDVTRLTGQVASMPGHPDAPEEAISVSDLMDEIRKADAENAEIGENENYIERLDNKIESRKEQLNQLRVQAADTKDRIGELMGERGKIMQDKRERTDTSGLQEQIDSAEEINSQVRANAVRLTTMAELRSLEKNVKAMTKKIKALDKKKLELIASAPFPIEGMSFDADGLTYQGLPLPEASSAEQLRVSLAVGVAGNPEFRGLLVRGGSLLDEDSLKLVDAWAEEHDVQVLMERVGTGGECQFIIEDGMVRDD